MAKSKLTRLRSVAGGASARQEFPQIYRIFNATPLKTGVKLAIFGLLAAFLAFNLSPGLPADFLTFERAKLAVMLSPKDLGSRLLLVQEYLKRGDMEAVERELLLAQDLVEKNPHSPGSSSVLGTSLSPLKILEKIRNEPLKIRNEISFWEKVVVDKPDYRDAYLQLAILNYQIYEKEKAIGYLKKAQEIDPNFEAIKSLEKILKD